MTTDIRQEREFSAAFGSEKLARCIMWAVALAVGAAVTVEAVVPSFEFENFFDSTTGEPHHRAAQFTVGLLATLFAARRFVRTKNAYYHWNSIIGPSRTS